MRTSLTVIVVLLAGCGGGTSSGTSTAGTSSSVSASSSGSPTSARTTPSTSSAASSGSSTGATRQTGTANGTGTSSTGHSVSTTTSGPGSGGSTSSGSAGGTGSSVCPTPPGGTPPAPAAAAGYDTQTFGPQITVGFTPNSATSYPDLTNCANWAPYTYFGISWTQLGIAQNADGSVTLNGAGEQWGDGITNTVQGNPAANAPWHGTAFGGGGYFEAVMATTGPASFWADDIETLNGANVGDGPNPWRGQASGYGNWIEADMAEFDSTGVYGFAMHNWYGMVGSGDNTSTLGSGSPASPPGADYTQKNKYGFLWVPATATSQGYAQWYFNETQVGNTITWNQYNPSSPPPPTDNGTGGGSAYSVMDTLHLALILGGAPGSTNTIYSVSVWQASAANNLTQ